MNYIQQLNAFEDWIELNYLPATEELLWRRLFRLNNMFGWAEWFFIDNLKLAGRVGISERALIDTRLNLKHKGLIDFISGKKGKPTRYKLTILYKNTEPISVNTSVKEENTEASSVETSVKTSVNSSVKTSANINSKPKLKTKTIINNYTANALLVEAIQDFIEMRNKIKKPVTDRALSMVFTELDKLVSTDEEKIAILNQSTMKCWRDVYPLKEPIQGQDQNTSLPTPDQVWDKVITQLDPAKMPVWDDRFIEKAINKYGYDKFCKMNEEHAKRLFCNAYSNALKEG